MEMNDELPHDDGDTDRLERLLHARHSCRAFLPDPVPRPIIVRILEIAQRTASWCNAQPWQVIVTSGAATERFRAACYARAEQGAPPTPDFTFPREYRGAALERRRECGWQLYESVGVVRGDRAASRRQSLENHRLFGAPHVAIVSTDEALGVYGAVDCGGYVANFLLAAESLGVAAIPQAALAAHSALIHGHFGLGADRRVVCGISFGYEDKAHAANSYRTTRARLDDVVTWAEE
jgi:nitroreductase